jgi:hypothetical protein
VGVSEYLNASATPSGIKHEACMYVYVFFSSIQNKNVTSASFHFVIHNCNGVESIIKLLIFHQSVEKAFLLNTPSKL